MDTDSLEELLRVKIPVAEISRTLRISRTTIYRYIRENRIVYERYTDTSDRELEEAILAIKENHPESGEVMVMGHLRRQGVYVQRKRIRDILRLVDAEGIERRRAHPIERRVYLVPCPHYIWHIDGNHKMIKWKFVIHGAIDGFTRLITYLKVCDNNRAATVHTQFLKAIAVFQRPFRIRTDHGGENQRIWEDMFSTRGPHSVLVGSSVHNERIERLWRDVNEKVTRKYKDLFQNLTDRQVVNPDNPVDLLCLHQVFRRLIQRDLTAFAEAHNCHGLSTEEGHSPVQLYALKKHLIDLHEGDFQPVENDGDHDGIHPRQLQHPLPHVQCTIDDAFSAELKDEVRAIGRPTSLHDAEEKFHQTAQVVGSFIDRNGHL